MDYSNGINIDHWAFYQARPQGEVNYLSGNRLVYTSNLDGGSVFDYVTSEKTIRLNDLIRKDWVFYPVESKFQVRFTSHGRTCPRPEVHLATIRINDVPGLRENELALFPVFHEIGHAVLYQALCGILGEKDARDTLSKNYNERLVETVHSFSKSYSHFSAFNERFAWRYAFHSRRKFNLLPDISDEELVRFSNSCLASYGREYLDPKNNFLSSDLDLDRILLVD